MSPRIRSFPLRPQFARDAKTTARAAPAREAPRVFREFVETLQRLDPEHARAGHGRVRRRKYGAQPRRETGNGHARPHSRRTRRRPQ